MNDDSIAIVGASCRFPGAADLDTFWRLLLAGADAVSEVDSARWATRFFGHPSRAAPGKSYTWAAGLLDGVDRFDPGFFGISPREAAQMDPQQRLLLELVWHAAEDAGIPAARLAGSATGVYIGASTTDYRDIRIGDPSGADGYFMTGGSLSILANRVSYVFDLHGPSFTVDTACSSSLVALHAACEAIRGEQIESAVVGGVNLLLSPYPFIGFCRASMLSPSGRCHAFDSRADGYVRGEGGGVIILKRLAQAVADGDPIRAVIRGTGVNSDGRTIGLSLPNQTAQAGLLRRVYERAGVMPDDLAFFEMHGTGTPAGDPIEAAAVGHALAQARRAKLPIGSVKSNIGHLEPASGMAGLIKAALALDHAIVPPSRCRTPNPKIPFDELNLQVLTAPLPLTAQVGSCAGVNSFGFGGTNGHAVLAAPPARASAAGEKPEPLPPLLLSARSETALRELAAAWRDRLDTTPPSRLPARLRGAARRRDHHPHRLVAFGGEAAELAMGLDDFLADPAGAAAVTGTALRDAGLAFVFSGNGAQWPDMGREAYRASAAFRDAVAEVDGLLRPALGWSAAAVIAAGVEPELLARADVAQPLLFAVQVGIVSALRGLGVSAAGHVGHSVGEIAAAWSAGALTLDDAVRVVVARSRNQEMTRGVGRMAALGLGGEAAARLLAELGSPLEIGAINASQSVTVSGPEAALSRLGDEARRRGVAFRPLDLDFAFHSAAMDPIHETLVADLKGLAAAPPRAFLASTVTGAAVEPGLFDAEYWWQNVRSPVRFAEAMAALVGAGHRILVEIGPTPILQSYLHDALRAGEAQGRVLGSLSRRDGPGDPFPTVAARCHVAGHDIAASAGFDGPADPRGLPLYPWQRERFWFIPTVEGPDLTNPQFAHPLLGFRQAGPARSWVSHLDPEVLPWLADHAIEGVPVLPAAATIEMVLATARIIRPEARALEAIDIELRRPVPFDNARAREMRTLLVGGDGDWELTSRPRLADEAPTVHAVARIVAASDAATRSWYWPDRPAVRTLDAAALYRLAAGLGLDYGAQFRTVSGVELLAPDEAVVALDPSVTAEPPALYLIHPALVDGALQGLLALLAEGHPQLRGISFLPWRFGRVRLAPPFGRTPVCARLRVTRVGTRSVSADIVLLDGDRGAVVELHDCWFRRVELGRQAAAEAAAFRLELVPAPPDGWPTPGFPAIGDTLSRRAAAAAGDDNTAGVEQSLLVDALVAAGAEMALRGLVDAGEGFSADSLIRAGRLAPEAAGLFDTLLPLLERFGAAAEANGVWRLAATHDLPDFDQIWRLLLADTPRLVAELALAADAAAELPRLLADGPHPAESSPVPMVEHLLSASPAAARGIAFVADALAEIAESWPAGRLLRVLELGAGGATGRVLDRLAETGAAFTCVATSPDAEQAARLAFAVEAVPGAAVRRWAPGEGGDDLEPASVDIVIAIDAAARLRLDGSALSRLREIVAPGGLLLIVEPEPNPLWDLVFGRDTGWWDGGRSPLRSREEWCNALAVAGFETLGAASLIAGPWPLGAVWAAVPAAAVKVARRDGARPVILVGGDDDVRERLAAIGCRVLPDADSPDADSPDADSVIFLAAADDPADTAGGIARRLVDLARTAAVAAERRARLYVVTEAAQQGVAGARASAVGGAVWGFARVLANETMPRLDLHLVDLPPGLDADARAGCLAAELRAASGETEIVWTEAGRHVLRLRRGLPPRRAHAGDGLALASGRLGALDALGWEVAAPRPAGEGEIEVEVHAAGLNFRDVMWATGLLPEEALIDGFAGPSFGLECAGIVRAVGPRVDGIAIGDRVAGFAPSALASRVTTAAHAVMPIPPGLDFAAAATVPVAFVTAIYALGTLGQLKAGEHVLIHAAAGGVGLAAIQYAKYRGAIVIATAGSGIKRNFLRLAGADHVLDSRDIGFADAVRAITGDGVDVVLNSLSGEAMEASLAVLKPFGRFLELGKRDFYENRRLPMRGLRQNVSYFAIDVDQLPVQRPELARALLAETCEALASGAIRPLAHRVFRFAEIADAFRLMQGSGHIGKLVVVPDANRAVRLRRAPPLRLRGDGVYLLTGGTAGFGFAAARFLVERGARSLALLGRRGAATPGVADRVAELEAAGARVRVYGCDVADRAALAEVLARVRAEKGPLRGVVHAASAISDGLAAEVEQDAAAAILRPKVEGALLLDELTRGDPIELFLLFSSATTLLGAPGQGVYVAANHALEALARCRRAEGRPALAIGWGPIADAGYLAERPETRDALARRLGATPMPTAEALAGLDFLVASGLAVASFAETGWNEARRVLPILSAPLFADIRGETGSSASDDSLIDRLAGLAADEALAVLKTVVAEEAGAILRLPAGAIDPQRPLSELGMDSLMAVELRLALETRLHIDLPLVSLAEGTSIASIAARLVGSVSRNGGGPARTNEVAGLVARYEAGDDMWLAEATEARGFEAPEARSAAAE